MKFEALKKQVCIEYDVSPTALGGRRRLENAFKAQACLAFALIRCSLREHNELCRVLPCPVEWFEHLAEMGFRLHRTDKDFREKFESCLLAHRRERK